MNNRLITKTGTGPLEKNENMLVYVHTLSHNKNWEMLDEFINWFEFTFIAVCTSISVLVYLPMNRDQMRII